MANLLTLTYLLACGLFGLAGGLWLGRRGCGRGCPAEAGDSETARYFYRLGRAVERSRGL